MTNPFPHLRFTGAEILRDAVLSDHELNVADGKITDTRGTEINLSGYFVLPGIIDLHGDAFERHLAPRPTAHFPFQTGLVSTDRDAAACGVTTAWMAQSWSWEGGARSPDYAETFLTAHQAYRPHQLTDLRVQIRCETHTVETEERLIAALRAFDVGYVIFNNHLDEAIETAKDTPHRIEAWAVRAQRSVKQHMALVHASKAMEPRVPRYLCNLATAFENLGIKYGSHDDGDGQARECYSMIGAKICEFPTSGTAASVAHSNGDPVLMGAPNVVRGGSQAGNIAAISLIRDGLCDALVSDYYYPALGAAAFQLADEGVMSLAQAWSMISATPAQIMGLSDRGTLETGKRADLTIINKESRIVEATMAGGRWTHLSGEIASRVGRSNPAISMAAE
ncbi:alpha-D-ribose 1-methylphosphonate 5-triphosphate diphosphatase [Litoreibacter roseus]|uniref:Alpha-D-ribose 1-methylphosphonate 5-triphosphate diphosphatase n=1 Tax=Litoreibacter roseus TaxID=2601869 RepID=A0A6N6JJ82_9RHOB|nr:alpha-D-ribose 1-methylphosphonate 5-triphosphate diphosphatase [Litoreibacter roseus]GFE66125.1 alpha-D-ribose 1-methylphosphonate 5-triphosphate diphosphatase [Litoreibacter roseus]